MAGEKRSDAFEREATARRVSFAVEFWQFLSENKKWWLVPICLVLLLIGMLVLVGGTAAAPFIYTLF